MQFRGSFYSPALQMQTHLTVIGQDMSENQPQTDTPYRVVYLLHDDGGNADSWAENTRLTAYAQQYHTLFIMPEVERSLYCDMRYGARYFTYLAQELPQFCRSLFHISATREDTAVIGGGVGAYGALKCALTYPECFGICVSLAPRLLFLNEELDDMRYSTENLDPALTQQCTAIFGTELCLCPQDHLLRLLEGCLLQNKPFPRLLLTDDDTGTNDTTRLCASLGSLGLPFEFHHQYKQAFPSNWLYLDDALQNALEWLERNE